MPPIHIHLKPSPLLAHLVWVGWFNLCILLTSAWQIHNLLSTLTLMIWLGVSFVCTKRWLRQFAWQLTPNAIVALHIAQNNWIVTFKTGTSIKVAPLLGSRFWPWLTVLRLRCANNKLYRVIILPDKVCPDAWRQLRVTGRWDTNLT